MKTLSIMKYFTPYWYGDIPYEEVIRRRDSYWEYIENISEKLPFPLRMLAKQINLHDAVITKFSYKSKEKSLFLQAYDGDLQEGSTSININVPSVHEYCNYTY